MGIGIEEKSNHCKEIFAPLRFGCLLRVCEIICGRNLLQTTTDLSDLLNIVCVIYWLLCCRWGGRSLSSQAEQQRQLQTVGLVSLSQSIPRLDPFAQPRPPVVSQRLIRLYTGMPPLWVLLSLAHTQADTITYLLALDMEFKGFN